MAGVPSLDRAASVLLVACSVGPAAFLSPAAPRAQPLPSAGGASSVRRSHQNGKPLHDGRVRLSFSGKSPGHATRRRQRLTKQDTIPHHINIGSTHVYIRTEERADDPSAAAQPSTDLRGPGGRQLLSGYYIVNASSGKGLDDPDFSTSNGAVIDQWQPNGGANQQWNLVPLSDGNDEVVNAYSGKVLDDPGLSTSNGTLIEQDQLKGGLGQQWKIDALTDGNDEVVNAYSGKVLDDPDFSTSDGTQIQQYQLNGGLNQQWTLLLSTAPLYVLGSNGNLWMEPPGWQTFGRTLVDSNVKLSPRPLTAASCTCWGRTAISGWRPPAGSRPAAP